MSSRREFRPRPGSMARALGVQNRSSWQVTNEIAFRPARVSQVHANPQDIMLSISPLLLFLEYHNSHQRLGSHGTTAALQGFAFVTATNGVSKCRFVSMRVCRVCHCRILQQ